MVARAPGVRGGAAPRSHDHHFGAPLPADISLGLTTLDHRTGVRLGEFSQTPRGIFACQRRASGGASSRSQEPSTRSPTALAPLLLFCQEGCRDVTIGACDGTKEFEP